jgi:WD40 repeat protein
LCPLVYKSLKHSNLFASMLSASQTLKQKKLEDYICSIAWDPENAYLAASTAGGLVVIYDNEEWKEEAKRRVAPKVGAEGLGTMWVGHVGPGHCVGKV